MIHFLMGLNDTYTSVRGSLLMLDPLPSFGQTYSLLIQEERQRQVKNSGHFLGDSAASFNAGSQRVSYQTPYKKPEGRRPFCEHCKKPGHTIEKCYKLHGYPSKQPYKPKGGKHAHNAWNEEETQQDPTQPMVNSGSNKAPPTILPGLDAEQSKQLMQFLATLQINKQQTTPSASSSSQTFSSAHMAGVSPFQYVTSVNTVCCTCKL